MKRYLPVFFFCILPLLNALLLSAITYEWVESWLTELLSFGVPLLILGNLSLFVAALILSRKFKYILPSFLALLLAAKPISETLAINFTSPERTSDFTVMSYNVATFNTTRMESKSSDSLFNASFYNWLRENESPDILCMQEFYHSDLQDYDNTLDSILRLGKYKYFYMNPVYKEDFNGVFGVITFSKFKALKSGEIRYGDSDFNKGTFHDFKIKNDTVRVLNFHLNSMSIRWNNSDTLSFFDRMSYNAHNIYDRLHAGYVRRKDELNQIEKFIDESPYKIIICADINSIPYSYTYQRLKSRFGNAFEQGGWGLGYTCNRFPWFVRIDNQFYDKRLKVDYFTTHSEMTDSDHYPIEAGYSFTEF